MPAGPPLSDAQIAIGVVSLLAITALVCFVIAMFLVSTAGKLADEWQGLFALLR